MAADGTDDREIASIRPFIGPFAWASNSDHIYQVERRPETGVGLYAISVSTGERKPVLLDHEILGHVASSPDGKRLAFGRGLRHVQIYVADVDGDNLRQVTFVDDDTVVGYPAWTPRSNELAFSLRKGEKGSLMVLNLEDGSVREVISSTVPEDRFFDSSWSPDGKQIAWVSRLSAKDTSSGDSLAMEIRTAAVSGDRAYQPFRVDLGSSVRTSTAVPRWSPDGRKMLFTAGHYIHQILLLDNFLADADSQTGPNAKRLSR
jgi:Tol biopolymer transport system component